MNKLINYIYRINNPKKSKCWVNDLTSVIHKYLLYIEYFGIGFVHLTNNSNKPDIRSLNGFITIIS